MGGRHQRHIRARFRPRIGVAAIVILGGLAVAAPPPAPAAATIAAAPPDWSKARFDAANTAFNPNETSLSQANVATLAHDWSAPITRRASPVVAGGVVYAGCERNSYCALDARDGTVRWKTVVAATVTPATAVLAGNVLYMGGSRPQTELALDATTGAVLWKTLVANGGGDFDSPIAVAEGLIVQGSGGFLFGWDATTGIQRWVVRLGVKGVPAILNGVVYVHADFMSPTLFALRATTGETLWRSNSTIGGLARAPIVSGGLVIVGSEDWTPGTPGRLSAYRVGGCGTGTCAPVWNYDAARTPDGDGAVSNGVLYQGFVDGYYVAIDVATGRELWKAATNVVGQAPPPTMGPVTVANGLVFAQAGGLVSAWPAGGCAAAICRPVWTTPLGYGTQTSNDIVVAAGRLYVADDLGSLHSYSARQNPPAVIAPPPVISPPPPAPAPTTSVTINVPRDQLGIQRAIDSSHAGDVVVVAPGVYHERLDFHGHAVEVRSAGGPGVTTIDGDGVSTVVVFLSEETRASTLRGFTILRGVGAASGGAILVNRASPTIAGNVITGNVANGGNGIDVYQGAPSIVGNQLRDNHPFGGVGGSAVGGAISLVATSGTEVRGNLIEDNVAGSRGGGLYLAGTGSVVVADNVIRRNSSGISGGGVELGGTGDVVFSQNVVVENRAGNAGGGVSLAGDPTVVGNTMAGNLAATGSSVNVAYPAPGMTLADNVLTGPAGRSVVECDHSYTDVVPSFSVNDVFSGDASPVTGCGAIAGGADPRFVNPGTGDYRLGRGSPAIDAGADTSPPRPATDVAGAPRRVDGNGDGVVRIDLGAYETQQPVPEVAPGDEFHVLAPARILDTRSGVGAPPAPLGQGAVINLQVTGRGGVPPTGVSAVVLNVTVTEPTATSYLTAWPAGATRPLASNLNYAAGQTVPNLVVVKVGDGGRVSVYNDLGSGHVIADVAGWYSAGSTGSRYSPLSPARVLDTRIGVGAPAAAIGPGSTLTMQVTERGGVPAAGVSAVVLNVTVTDPTATSFLTAWPAGATRPLASNLNVVSGQTVANVVVVKVGDGGKVSLYNNAGSGQVLADIAGWFGDGTTAGAGFNSLTPARLLDTRAGVGAPAFKPGPATVTELQVTGRGGVPATGVSAVVLNVTVTEPTATSFLTAWPTGPSRPLASNLNYTAGRTVANVVVVKVGANGMVNLYNNLGSAHLIADVAGWYGSYGT